MQHTGYEGRHSGRLDEFRQLGVIQRATDTVQAQACRVMDVLPPLKHDYRCWDLRHSVRRALVKSGKENFNNEWD